MSRQQVVKSWKLVKASLGDYRKHWWEYSRIVLIVQVPLGLLGIWLSADSAFGAYSSLATIIMNMALIYTVAQVVRGEGRPGIKETFYAGTTRFLPYILVSLALVVILIPALLGLAIFSLVTTTQDGLAAPLGQQILGAVIALILSIPSLWLGVRWLFAPYAVMLDGLDPIEAIKASRNLTLGRYWKLLGRLLALIITILAVATIIAVPSLLIGQITDLVNGVLAVFQIISTSIVLPLTHIYLLKLYRSLHSERA